MGQSIITMILNLCATLLKFMTRLVSEHKLPRKKSRFILVNLVFLLAFWRDDILLLQWTETELLKDKVNVRIANSVEQTQSFL